MISIYDTIYYGQIKDNKRHGKGLCVRNEQEWRLYECWFIDDEPVYGRKIFRKGSVYTGEFNVYYQEHGKGKMIWFDGDTYEGEYNNGEREGYGIISYADGGKYEGM